MERCFDSCHSPSILPTHLQWLAALLTLREGGWVPLWTRLLRHTFPQDSKDFKYKEAPPLQVPVYLDVPYGDGYAEAGYCTARGEC